MEREIILYSHDGRDKRKTKRQFWPHKLKTNKQTKNTPAVKKGKDCSVSIQSRGCNLPGILTVKETAIR